jgi:hypothetical protein
VGSNWAEGADGIETIRPTTKEEARARCLPGWNLRCNYCGVYGAEWTRDSGRPGWGSLALCPLHMRLYRAEIRRHADAMADFAEVRFEQDRD